ncbi:MAG: VOC family protein [Patescibacteria group bacterium]
MDKVVHFEIPMDDKARAMKFYKSAFGWNLVDMPEMDYVMAHTMEMDEQRMPKEVGAINGGLAMRKGTFQTVSFAIDVEDIDAAALKVVAEGGTIVKEKTPVGDMGFIVYFKDTEGNLLSLWQTVKK